jgi:hypothetical protein
MSACEPSSLPSSSNGRARFRQALQAMQDRGEIRASADPAVLAETVLALFEGGILIATVHKRIDPLRHALDRGVQPASCRSHRRR